MAKASGVSLCPRVAKLSHVTAIIEQHRSLTGDLLNSAWELYYTAFEEIDTLAVQRHMMTWEEFSEVAYDKRVGKYVATADGEVIGLSTLTNDLEAWPLISPRYFERHYSADYEARRIWYVGFVCARRGPRPSPTLFADLIAAMYPFVIESGGFAVMDYCSFNVTPLQLPEHANDILKQVNPTTRMREIDSQRFYTYSFAPGSGS